MKSTKESLLCMLLLLGVGCNSSNNDDGITPNSAYITKVLDYMPAPGQFTNLMPEYAEGDSQEQMNAKVLESIGYNALGSITLGGYGGYVVVGFDHTIENRAGLRDFRVIANASYSATDDGTTQGGSCEAGVVMVAYDANKNGVADSDEWYEIAGSAHIDPSQEAWYEIAAEAGNDVEFYADYQITYSLPADGEDYYWSDNKGDSGYIPQNSYHTQSYFPQWIDSESLTFEGSRLPQNGVAVDGNPMNVVLYKFDFGYADNDTNSSEGSAIDISWAVDQNGNSVDLEGVDFIKIYTGINQVNGWFGECSTEVAGIEDLHILGVEIESL